MAKNLFIRGRGHSMLIILFIFMAGAAPLGAEMCPQPVELEVIDRINRERENAGLSPLAAEVRLGEAAFLHSEDMAFHNIFNHTGSDGSSPWDRFARAGYPMTRGAENIAAGYGTPAAVVEGWMNSSGHRANILNGNVKHIGVGHISHSASDYGRYWTADFGSSSDAGRTIPEYFDVAPGHWARAHIKILACRGITAGCGGGDFCPDDPITRAQMAAFLVRTLSVSPAETCSGAVFEDVSLETVGADFCRYIETFRDLGITSGCGDNDYCPEGEVSRGQMAVFILRARGESPSACTGLRFGDVSAASVGAEFCGYIEKLAALGITSGCGNGNYCPHESVTRAQMAVFLWRAFWAD